MGSGQHTIHSSPRRLVHRLTLASVEATRAFVSRKLGASALRSLGGLGCAPVGLGTYKTEREHVEGIVKAVSAGANLIDTSNHYTRGRSESTVGEAIARIVKTGLATREELVLVTKVGHVDEEHLASPRWAGGSQQARAQVSSSPAGGYHCIHPDLI